MSSSSGYRKWRVLALLSGLMEIAVIGVGLFFDLALKQPAAFDPPVVRTMLLIPLTAGCWAAHKLHRSPLAWAFSVLFWGVPFLILARIGPAHAPRVSHWKRRRMVAAVRRGDTAYVRRALGEGFPVDRPLGWFFRRTALMEAAFKGQIEIARALLGAGADANARTRFGETLLMLACAGGDLALVRLLLERGADARAKMNDGPTPLGHAIHQGRAEIARALLEAGAKTSDRVAGYQSGFGAFAGTALSFAEKQGKPDVLQVLRQRAELERQQKLFESFERALEKGGVATLIGELADVNLRGPRNRTPLIVAAGRGHQDAVAQLLKAGADVGARDDTGRTALHAAVEDGSAAVTAKLLSAGADVDAAAANGETPLLTACRCGSAAAASTLLSAGANLAARGREDAPALVLAARSGRWELERDLLAAGATREAAYDSLTAQLFNSAVERQAVPELLWRLEIVQEPQLRQRGAAAGLLAAAARGDERAVEAFLEAGARIDSVDQNGRTPISLALHNGHAAVVQHLIGVGADFGGAPALTAACRRGQTSLARVLIQAGADVNARDASGASVLLIAARSGSSELERELLAAGALADESYDQFTESRAREQELERQRRKREDAEAKQREAERQARLERLRAVAGHQRCLRCAAGRAWFIGRALAAFSGGGGGGRPHDFAGACERCQNYFCSAHADDDRCPFCRAALR